MILRQVRVVLPVAISACLLAITMMLSACARTEPATELAPPAAAVDALLSLRAERSQDASAYAQYLMDPALAIDLARAAAEETSTLPPTPDWEEPYVSSETSSTAQVVVVWGDRAQYPDWPAANVFLMEFLNGRWVVADAQSVADTQTVPPRP